MKARLIALLASAALTLPVLAGATVAQDEDLKVDLNRAGVEELIQLPGIGKVVAERIVTYRNENGRFEATEELMNVRGIGEKTYLKLESYLTVSEKTPEQSENEKK